ncbi:MAG TPA: ABC transporter permease subunit [Bacteroidota bacterium]|nr:ABC transporter permease subunit [Bacteroidota bacterium]
MIVQTLVATTLREMLSKATLYILLGISTLVLLGTFATFSSISTDEGIVLKIFGLPVSPPTHTEEIAPLVFATQSGLARGLFLGLMLFGVFATAGLVPDVLEKGVVELYLAKPMARWQLLLGKYLGGAVAIGIVTIYFIGGVWLTFGIRVGVWNTQFLLSSLTMTFMFTAILSIVVLLGVLFRNAAVPIIGCFLYLMVLDNLLEHRETILYVVSESVLYRGLCDLLFYLLPQVSGMQQQLQRQIMHEAVEWQPFLQSLFSSGLLFGLAWWVLDRRDL